MFSNILVMDLPRIPRKHPPRFIKYEKEGELKKFKSEINFHKKYFKNDQEFLLKI